MKMDKRTAEMILRCLALENIDRLDIKSAIAIALEGLENLPDEVTVETCGGDDEEVEG